MTFATNFITATLSAAVVEQMIAPWQLAALVAFLTGCLVMAVLIRVNPKS